MSTKDFSYYSKNTGNRRGNVTVTLLFMKLLSKYIFKAEDPLFVTVNSPFIYTEFDVNYHRQVTSL